VKFHFYFSKILLKFFLIAEVRKDVSGQFQIAMLLGDVEERIKLLTQCNQSKIEYFYQKNILKYLLNRITCVCYGSYTWS